MPSLIYIVHILTISSPYNNPLYRWETKAQRGQDLNPHCLSPYPAFFKIINMASSYVVIIFKVRLTLNICVTNRGKLTEGDKICELQFQTGKHAVIIRMDKIVRHT